MPVRRRDDRLAAAEGVGQRARGDLRRVQVGGDVDVGRPDELGQLVQLDEPVVEDDVPLDAELAGQALEAQPIALALLADQLRMGRAEDDVDEVRDLREDLGDGPEHVLDALVGREQAEGQGDRPPLDAELLLVGVRVDEGRVGDAVGDEVDLGLGHAVDLAEEHARPFGHDDDPRRQLRELDQDPTLVGVRLAQDRVEGRDDRHPEVAHQAEDVAARRAAVDAVLVLERDDVGVREVQEVGRPEVAVQILLGDLEPDLRRVVVSFGAIVDRHDGALGLREPAGHRGVHVVGEGGDPALAREIVADEGDLVGVGIWHDQGLHRGSSGGRARGAATLQPVAGSAAARARSASSRPSRFRSIVAAIRSSGRWLRFLVEKGFSSSIPVWSRERIG